MTRTTVQPTITNCPRTKSPETADSVVAYLMWDLSGPQTTPPPSDRRACRKPAFPSLHGPRCPARIHLALQDRHSRPCILCGQSHHGPAACCWKVANWAFSYGDSHVRHMWPTDSRGHRKIPSSGLPTTSPASTWRLGSPGQFSIEPTVAHQMPFSLLSHTDCSERGN